jgi:hypothetical protein
MNADRAAAIRAGPSDFFVCRELPNAKPANVLQILDHAHAVARPITFIQLLQAGTGELLTLEAESWFLVSEVCTVFDPASNAIARLIDADASAAGTFVFIPQISQANAAVHSAGGDE